jgi:hypothetical protein
MFFPIKWKSVEVHAEILGVIGSWNVHHKLVYPSAFSGEYSICIAFQKVTHTRACSIAFSRGDVMDDRIDSVRFCIRIVASISPITKRKRG